jgi:outer membrane protein assembly factor BamB
MKHLLFALAFLVVFTCSFARADEPTKLTGWRGNWTGEFPDSNIPTTWGRVSKLMSGVRAQAKQPDGDKPGGTSAYAGVISDWLVIGPFTPKDPDKPLDDPFIATEQDLRPDAGQKVGDNTWKVAATDGNMLDFDPLLKDGAPGQVAYAHTYIYSAVAGPVMFKVGSDNTLGCKVWINGKVPPQTAKVDFVQGWNRVLVKVCKGGKKEQSYNEFLRSQWKFTHHFYACAPAEFQASNIIWATKMPSWCGSCPIVVADKVFAMSEDSDLVCLDKKTGKILWIRSNTFYDAATPQERKADDAFGQMEPIVARLKIINDAFGSGAGPAKELRAEKTDLTEKLFNLTRKIDNDKYYMPQPDFNHAGYAIHTPCSDGRNVYIMLSSGVVACYDLQGNRKWINRPEQESLRKPHEHAFPSSPVLAGGKFITCLREFIAFDAKTGDVAWRKPDLTVMSSLVPFKIAGQDAVYASDVILRASDGKELWLKKEWESCGDYITPVIQKGTVYTLATMAGRMHMGTLPVAMADKVDVTDASMIKLPPGDSYDKRMICASPLIHDGLAYLIDMVGCLHVIDLKTQNEVYEKRLYQPENRSHYHAEGSFYASPILAGKYIYFLNSTGATLVIEPGRTFKLVAINKLENHLSPDVWFESPEHFAASPVCDGNRLYIRGDDCTYCIGEK